MKARDIDKLDWEKGAGLLPVIVQDQRTGTVLMTGFVNRQAVALMLERRQVVLYSRTRKRLWIKGESSGNYINVTKIVADCDRDAILVLGGPSGPACHTGSESCFEKADPMLAEFAFLDELQEVIARRLAQPQAGSYTAALAASGMRRVAQKVGEEALEVALAADAPEAELCSESADLVFHLLLLLKMRRLDLRDVIKVLRKRNQHSPASVHASGQRPGARRRSIGTTAAGRATDGSDLSAVSPSAEEAPTAVGFEP
jgi:phosphoribosyl-ATP pyrophosphohydrolase/phosphoribosyl-AMP cyclohydrolase